MNGTEFLEFHWEKYPLERFHSSEKSGLGFKLRILDTKPEQLITAGPEENFSGFETFPQNQSLVTVGLSAFNQYGSSDEVYMNVSTPVQSPDGVPLYLRYE